MMDQQGCSGCGVLGTFGEWGAVIARRRAWGDAAGLNTMARTAAALPAPRVTFVLSFTMLKVLSIGFVPGMNIDGGPFWYRQ
ncbi:hypothetical protein GCM10010121_071740 [Streptomyces brasiliensis]|uniref:Uncharacterized protein n=1 Tax=Streptomyces brasiliensis TaxID=1954 RepID=A0A917L7R9_9ACTN|nr:hypothetical protein GCM10010121_071740 [Streptomyces brasiliensis]